MAAGRSDARRVRTRLAVRTQRTVRDEVDYASHLGVVVVVGGLGEQAPPIGQAFVGGRLVQESEQAEGHLQVGDHRSPTGQGRPLEGHADATGDHVGHPLARTQAEARHERPGEAECEALVRSLAAKAGAAGLATLVDHLAGASGPPGTQAAQWAGVGAIAGADDRRGDVGGSGHEANSTGAGRVRPTRWWGRGGPRQEATPSPGSPWSPAR